MKHPSASASFLLLATLSVVVVSSQRCSATVFLPAQASFYGTRNGTGADAGACGLTNLTKTPGYGLNTVSVSGILFQGGAVCGACYEVKCEKAKTNQCKTNASIFVTVTNYCPDSPGGFCSNGQVSLSLTQLMYTTLFWSWNPVVLPVSYRRVACNKTGGIRFRITEGTDPKFLMLSIANTNGAGDVAAAEVSFDSGKTWRGMSRNWGLNWFVSDRQTTYGGKGLSLRVTAQATNEKVAALNVIPKTWSVGGVYTSTVNFKVSP